MKRNLRLLWIAPLLAGLPFGLTGCSGIHGSQSISPATFLLPGFGQTQPVGPVPQSRFVVSDVQNLQPAVFQETTLAAAH